MKSILSIAALLLFAVSGLAQVPAKPPIYFNDLAGVVSPAVAHDLNEKLAQAERDTTDQIIVAIYPSAPGGDFDIDSFTHQTFEAWKIGQKGKDNGNLLLYYVTSADGHGKIRIEVGRGLEGALTDAQSIEIIHSILPQLRAKQYDAAFQAAVPQLIAATRGEFKGDGKTDAEKPSTEHASYWWFLLLLIPGGVIALIIWRALRPREEEDIPHILRGPRGYSSATATGRPFRTVPPLAPSRRSRDDDDSTTSFITGAALGSSLSSSSDSSSSSSSFDSSPSIDTSSSFDSGGGDSGGGGASSDV